MAQTQRKSGVRSLIAHPLLAGAVAAAAAASVPAAAADIFLKLDGITGESTDTKHKGEIEILSYTQSFANSATVEAGTAGGVGKLTCGAVTVLKNIDRSSPEFIRLVTTGAHVPNGVITFRTGSGGAQSDYYKVSMTDVIVTAVNQTDSANDSARIVERVSILADRFMFEYTTVDSKTGGPGPTFKFGWDCARNVKF